MITDIFSYKTADGAEKWADPLAIDRRLRALLGQEPATALAQINTMPPILAFEMVEKLAFATCHAFELGFPFNKDTGQGVRESVWLDALTAFVEWMEKNAQEASSLPTCSKPSQESGSKPHVMPLESLLGTPWASAYSKTSSDPVAAAPQK